MYKKKENCEYYFNRHSCFLLQYHIVLVTKYRNPILQGEVKDYVYKLIKEMCDERNYNILELNGEADYVHLLLETMPDMSPQEFINVLKTKTARFTRRDFPNEVVKYYWKPVFWSSSYFVRTVSEHSTELVKHYIRNQ